MHVIHIFSLFALLEFFLPPHKFLVFAVVVVVAHWIQSIEICINNSRNFQCSVTTKTFEDFRL